MKTKPIDDVKIYGSRCKTVLICSKNCKIVLNDAQSKFPPHKSDYESNGVLYNKHLIRKPLLHTTSSKSQSNSIDIKNNSLKTLLITKRSRGTSPNI